MQFDFIPVNGLRGKFNANRVAVQIERFTQAETAAPDFCEVFPRGVGDEVIEFVLSHLRYSMERETPPHAGQRGNHTALT